MASPGNSVYFSLHNNEGDSAETTFNRLRNAKLSPWVCEGDWVLYENKRIGLTILDGKVCSSNVLTDGKEEEGSKEYVKKILLSFLHVLSQNNPDQFSFEIADTDPLNQIIY